MTAYVALLRAVNVGGKNRISMTKLREALTDRGLESVSTILQSGNVVFSTAESEFAASACIGEAIRDAFGFRVGVITRSAAELMAVAGRNPFLGSGHEHDPATLHVAFLSKRPNAAAITTLDPDRSPPDAFTVVGREVYLSYPNGSGRSRLTLDYLERRLAVEGTARNWRTVQRLAALVGG